MCKIACYLIVLWLGLVVFITLNRAIKRRQDKSTYLFALLNLDPHNVVARALYLLFGCFIGIPAAILLILFGQSSTLEDL